MTCRYSEINQHDALYKVAREYPGGIEALYARVPVSSAAILYSKLRPGVKTHHVNFEEVSQIIDLCQEAKVENATLPIHAFCWRHGMVAYEIPQTASELSDKDLSALLLRVMKEMGDLSGEVINSNKDKKITTTECDRIEKECQEVMAALVEMRTRITRHSKGVL